jgi:uncharacterized membrane protein YfcA
MGVDILLLVLLGTAVGCIGTLVGVGGGFILIPVLTLAYPSAEARTIVAVSFFVVMANSLSGTLGYMRLARRGLARIAYGQGTIYMLATLPGAVGGSLLKDHLPRSIFDIILGTVLIFGSATLFLLGGRDGLKRRAEQRRARSGQPALQMATTSEAGGPGTLDLDMPPAQPRLVLTGVLISAFVGFVASLVGIGGGIIHVPAMVFLLDFPVHVATATSQFILMGTSIAGSATNIFTGDLHGIWGETVALSLGAVVGAQIGAKLSSKAPPTVIIRVLAVVIALVALRIILRSMTAS